MSVFLRQVSRFQGARSQLWRDQAPARAELFGVERLESHAASLALAQDVTVRSPLVLSLQMRLTSNAAVLLAAYRVSAGELALGRDVVPAAEWLLDNYHLVEAQIREVRDDLPPGYYRQLPKLASGPFRGYPRMYGLMWSYVAHTDSLFDPETLRRYLAAYQGVQPLMIGELWAVSITLRIVLIENLRRLVDKMTLGMAQRAKADMFADAMLRVGGVAVVGTADAAIGPVMTDDVAAQLAKRLRDLDPETTPALGWLEGRLAKQSATPDMVVGRVQERQGASNVSVRNVITSMRLISDTDWSDMFEASSQVEAQLRHAPCYAKMDFVSRNLYRSEVERLARGSKLDENAVTQAALSACDGQTGRAADPGYHLLAEGRPVLETAIGFRPSLRLRMARQMRRMGLRFYLGATFALSGLLLLLSAWVLAEQNAPTGLLVLWTVMALLPATEVARALIDRAVGLFFDIQLLPGLELKEGVPTSLRTLVVMPTLLTTHSELMEQIEQLEVHHLSGRGGDITFALLTDGSDSLTEVDASDADLLESAAEGLAALNARHAPGPAGSRFRHLHRHRRWNDAEGVWMGWERKRGKLVELNHLLRGAADTSYTSGDVPADVRFVITLDSDTRLPRDAATRLVGKLAHPLNRAVLDPSGRLVVRGHGILQPRVTPSLPQGSGSLYLRVTSGPAGLDPYASAISDVYQDLLGEGNYTGKGIYDVDAFEAALNARVPENALLSHDLFEGIFARAGLASDVELVEEFPDRLDVAVKRQHRWTRGDWQLLPWVLGHRPMPAAGRVRVLDTLRRSLLGPFTLATLCLGWLLPFPASLAATLLLIATVALPALLPLLFAIAPTRYDVRVDRHLRNLAQASGLALLQIGLTFTFLADTSLRMLDAVLRSLVRLTFTRRHMLEWTTAAATATGGVPSLVSYLKLQAGSILLGLGIVGITLILSPVAWPLVLPFAVLWLAAPFVALRISRAPPAASAELLTDPQLQSLRGIARRTWRFFETFVTAEDRWLPPDNCQFDPITAVAHRTSPTNIGLYLLSCVAARDFGWTGLVETTERLENTLTTLSQMQRHRGHFFNWYDTRDLSVLPPAYVSSVDSGNLAGHLLALANACEEWAREADAPPPMAGLADTAGLTGDYWEQARQKTAAALDRDAALTEADLAKLSGRLMTLASQARAFALQMDFAFLMDPERKLLSIGYSVDQNALDNSCYDLLASEARLASFFAIAKGDAPTRHWFRLGRTATAVGTGSALLSWSGSMFEYLMPALVMEEPFGSLLAETNRRAVERQKTYARSRSIPWGISESAFNARDIGFTYQYSNFGVPGLGLKRGLSDNLVIAPYATGLATMIDPVASAHNFDRLAAMGALCDYGFFEAIDYTPARRPEGADHVIIQSVMAHHQGMSLVAIANTVHDGRMRARFHREPMVKAAELLLQERSPRDVPLTAPRAEDVRANISTDVELQTLRRYVGPVPTPPVTHLLSNGRYGVMLTAGGCGYSRWGDIAITRWREDATRDNCGSFIYLKDRANGTTWSATAHPLPHLPDDREVQFREDSAEYILRDKGLTTTTDILVSSEDDSEVRRVTLSNTGRRTRDIDVTSFMGLVLTSTATDTAHPAFAKMFVQTEYLPECAALIATRRSRGPDEPPVWAAHFAVVEGQTTGPLQWETDRARFLGRGRSHANPQALDGPLSGTTGTVLDPIFSLRQGLRLAPGSVTRIAFWTVVSSTRESLIDLIDHHNDRSSFERARTLAWTQAQVQLRHLDVIAQEAADFQRLAAPILYADSRYRAPQSTQLRGAGPQSGLWGQRVSGDLPIILLRIDATEDMDVVRQLLRAHEYLRMKRLAVDLVILNEHPASYVQDLQNAIETAVRSSQSRPRSGGAQALGAVHTLRADLMGTDTRDLLSAVARVVLHARRGPIEAQLVPAAIPAKTVASAPPPARLTPAAILATPDVTGLEFFNGLGGFAKEGREYVTILDAGRVTPAPWINVVANPGFGFHVSAMGSGFVWAENSRENQLTPWSNDPVVDPSFDAFYIRDLATGEISCPTAAPIRDSGRYIARHGFGYSQFEHEAMGIAMTLLQFVPVDDAIRISELTLKNLSDRPRRLSVTTYNDWVMGTNRAATARYITTERDAVTGALLARNPFGLAFPGRVGFADLCGTQTSWTSDRAEFLGPRRGPSAPQALVSGQRLSGNVGAGYDPCAVLSRTVDLAPGQSITVVSLLGQASDLAQAQTLVAKYRTADPQAVLAEVTAHWQSILGAVQVKTPDRAMDIMLNGWLLYQTIACRLYARAGFYQASGAYGFRDQLQDGMALSLTQPDQTRAHLLRAAGRQFVEGDLQHWWLPQSGQGVRTRISDDRVWLAFAAATYVATSGDSAVLDEVIPFLEGPLLAPGAHDAFFQPLPADVSASLFEHCALALDQSIALTGPLGLPLMGTGDWNDGMNRVGEAGRGESVWLGWFLLRTLTLFTPLADSRDPLRADLWRAHATTLRASLEAQAWDGNWYRRATFDDGTWMGSSQNAECQIDSIAQSWAVFADALPERSILAMDAVSTHLIIPKDGLALLFAPPFNTSLPDPGYIKGYPPGLRENGGQYSHAAMWAVLAFAKMGRGDKAAALFALLNPINHARTRTEAERYKVEPYVIAADVYSQAPHVGRGGWTWYTGSAAWMYRAGIEGILGITRQGDALHISPCLPPDWPGFSAELNVQGTAISLKIDQNHSGPDQASLNGTPCDPAAFVIPLNGKAQVAHLSLRGKEPV